MKKLYFASFALCGCLGALDFAPLGNIPASVGGAGVAYKKNNWAIYYNPALLSATRDTSIAYSFGVGLDEENVLELAGIDYDNLVNMPRTFDGLFKSQTAGITRMQSRADTTAKNVSYSGFLKELLGKIENGGSPITNSDSLEKYLTANGNNFDKIKQDLQDALTKVSDDYPGAALVGGILDNLSGSDIKSFVEGFENGNFDLKDLASKVNLTISKGSGIDSIDQLIDDFKIIDRALKENNVNIRTNDGLSFQIPTGKNGTIGFGVLLNHNSAVNFNTNIYKDNTIVFCGDNNNKDSCYGVKFDGDKIIIIGNGKNPNITPENSITNNKAITLHTNNLALFEVPIAYGHRIPLVAGELHLGASLKYIYALGAFYDATMGMNSVNFNFNLNDIHATHTFGVDLGALYTISGFSVGIVGKNLNSPNVKVARINENNKIIEKLSLDRQLRAGLGLELWDFTILADVDLMPNNSFDSRKKSQFIGGGVIYDPDWAFGFNLRFGAMQDLNRKFDDVIITGGINLFHFLDIAFQTSTKLKDVSFSPNSSKYRVPSYLDLRIGGSFRF